MSVYAVELFFDSSFDAKVREMWKALSDLGISEHMHNIEHLRPHISLNSFSADGVSDAEVIKSFHQLRLPEESFNLSFESISTFFPATGTVYLAPKASEKLLVIHREFYASFDEQANLESNPFYVPGKWDAHCTLAIRVPLEQIARAVDHCLNHLQESLQARVIAVGLVKIFVESGVVTATPTIAEKSLV